MFQRFHELKSNEEKGFTLIELLVVILIVAILAAVAIPVFLRQREKGYVDQMESALKNAATAAESYATSNNGEYPVSGGVTDADGVLLGAAPATDFANEGYSPTVDVQLTFTNNGDGTWSMVASHTSHDCDYEYDSEIGAPEEVAGC